jgi:hypothetical protein
MDSNDRIEKHVESTNGRVLALEEKVVKLEVTDELHITTCPAMPIVKKLEDDINGLKIEGVTVWIKKHWKLSIFMSIILLYVSYSLFSYFSIEQIIEWIK